VVCDTFNLRIEREPQAHSADRDFRKAPVGFGGMMNQERGTEDYLKELNRIEDELKELWKMLSPSERQKRPVVQKMNRVKMTLYRIRSSNLIGK